MKSTIAVSPHNPQGREVQDMKNSKPNPSRPLGFQIQSDMSHAADSAAAIIVTWEREESGRRGSSPHASVQHFARTPPFQTERLAATEAAMHSITYSCL